MSRAEEIADDRAYVAGALATQADFMWTAYRALAMSAFLDRRHTDRLPRRKWRRLLAVGRQFFWNWKGGPL